MEINVKEYTELVKTLGEEKAKAMVEGKTLVDDDGNEVTVEVIKNRKATEDMQKTIKDAVAESMKEFKPSRVEITKDHDGETKNFVTWAKNYLQGKQTTFNSANTNANGAILLPSLVSPDICGAIFESQLVSKANKVPVQYDTLRIPSRLYQTNQVSQTSSQGALKSETKVQFASRTITLQTSYALTPVANEFMEDLPQILSQVRVQHQQDMQRTIENGIINGAAGAGFTGIVGDAGTVSPGRTTAGTVVRADLANMFSRMWFGGGADLASLVWIINPGVFPAIESFRDANAINVGNAPQTTFYGIPIVMSALSPALGSRGDVLLADMSKYVMGVKGNGEAREAISPDVFFHYNLTTLRTEMRMAGVPCLTETIQENGRHYGYFVELDSDADGSGTDVNS